MMLNCRRMNPWGPGAQLCKTDDVEPVTSSVCGGGSDNGGSRLVKPKEAGSTGGGEHQGSSQAKVDMLEIWNDVPIIEWTKEQL